MNRPTKRPHVRPVEEVVTGSQRPSDEWTRYEVEREFFSLNVPASWTAYQRPGGSDVFAAAHETDPEADFPPNIVILGEDRSPSEGAEGYRNACWVHFQATRPTFREDHGQTVQAAGNPVALLNYTESFPQGDARFLQAYFVHGRRKFIMTCAAKSGEFDRVRDTYEAMVGDHAPGPRASRRPAGSSSPTPR